MTEWPEDLTVRSLNELQSLRELNRALARDLRLKSASLVNRRLAKEISLDDYLETRKENAESAVECRRRAQALESEIAYRKVYSR